ncbi:hypothetical protein [Alteromonas flava]|uniref:hypothetical protein n=1 Tax=Alteromonas flava TaxID=2048003 RepID=UPI000C28EE29|nr:hypothetical protein [Alteromonas flava]
MKYWLVFGLLLVVAGCGSTPVRDGYAHHINLLNSSSLNTKALNLQFIDVDKIDVRGVYDKNDTVGDSTVLYQGGAGVVGLIAQVGIHSAMVNSQRNKRLDAAQKAANDAIAPLIQEVSDMSLLGLVSPSLQNAFQTTQHGEPTITLEPIFYSSQDMQRLSLNMIVSLTQVNSAKPNARKVLYRNLVKVHAPVTDGLFDQRANKVDKSLLERTSAAILNTAIKIAVDDISGKFSEVNGSDRSFVFKDGEANRIIRGVKVAERCGFDVIRNLHQWYVAIPSKHEAYDQNKLWYSDFICQTANTAS